MKNPKEFEALKALANTNFALLEDGRAVYMTQSGEVRDMDTRLLLPADPIRAALYLKNNDKSTGTGIPSDPGAYKYMATDGEGNWVAEDRLAWKEVEKNELFNQTVGFVVYEDNSANNPDQIASSFGHFVIGEKYTVVWDGVEYPDLIAFYDYDEPTIGSPEDEVCDKLPFSINTYEDSEKNVYVLFITNSHAETHTISIYGVSETIHPIPEEYIPERKTHPVTEETVDGVEKWVCGLDFATACNMSPESLRESLTYRATQNNPIECAKINTILGQYWILHFHHMSVDSTTNVLSEETVYLKWDENGITKVTTA